MDHVGIGIAGLLATLGVGCGHTQSSSHYHVQNTESVRVDRSDDLIDLWQGYVRDRSGECRTIEDVERILAGRYRDKAVWEAPGTGDRFVFIRIDDVVELVVECDRRGNVRNQISVRRIAGKFMRRPDGYLLAPP
jgi:hypothetical protein